MVQTQDQNVFQQAKQANQGLNEDLLIADKVLIDEIEPKDIQKLVALRA